MVPNLNLTLAVVSEMKRLDLQVDTSLFVQGTYGTVVENINKTPSEELCCFGLLFRRPNAVFLSQCAAVRFAVGSCILNSRVFQQLVGLRCCIIRTSVGQNVIMVSDDGFVAQHFILFRLYSFMYAGCWPLSEQLFH